MDRDRGGRFDDRSRPPRRPYRGPPPYASENFAAGRGESPPPRRGRSPPPGTERYGRPNDRTARPRSRSPQDYRRRSRTPPYRGKPRSPNSGATWRARERSPPPGGWPAPAQPGANVPQPRYNSPPPNGRYRSRSPIRAPRERPLRTDEYERSRDPIPQRSPQHNERPPYDNGPRPYQRGPWRKPSPGPRDERSEFRRQRSASPRNRTFRPDYRSNPSSGDTSRRSSPPVHPSRLAHHQNSYQASGEAPYASTRGTNDYRPPGRRPLRSPLPPQSPNPSNSLPPEEDVLSPQDRMIPTHSRRRGYSPDQVSPRRDSAAYGAPPDESEYQSAPYEDDYEREDPRGRYDRNGYDQGGNSSYDSRSPVGAIPSGPAASSSYYPRGGNASLLSAPRQPRGSGPPPRRESSYSGGFAPDSRRGGPPSRYPQSYGRGHSRGGPYGPGPGPRGGGPPGPRGGYGAHSYRPSHNSTSKTYPLTQRFARQLSDLPDIIPGGKAASSGVDKSIADRLAKLQQEQEKLQKELSEKEEKKRQGLRGWDRLERESARDGLKSELAEQQVRAMAGEGELGGAAF